MNISIDYEQAIDFEHCQDLEEASRRLSQLTNILNQLILIRQGAKQEIFRACAKFPDKQFHKLSWDNKLVLLSAITEDTKLSDLWQDADTAYKQVKNKQDQVLEDINALKKMVDVTPR